MRAKQRFFFVIVLLLLVACQAETEPVVSGPDLRFEAPVAINAEGEWHVSLGVHNAGDRPFPGDEAFNAIMDLHLQSGQPRARMDLFELGAIPVADTVWPTSWRGELDPGDYELFWGAPSYGYTRVGFSVIERDGRPEVVDLVEEPAPDETMPAPTDIAELDALLAQARDELAAARNIAPDDVTVVDVEWVEFPDASLGVPEPGMNYAQVITPGYIIRLQADGSEYTYHASGDRLVPVAPQAHSPLAETKAPQVVVQNFYDWYLDYARNVGNPLVDRAYQASPYLSQAFVARVDEIIASFEGGGYDPFLHAQDIPESIEVDSPVFDDAGATVVVEMNWAGNDLPSLVTVRLAQIEGAWQIVDIVGTEIEPPEAVLTPQKAVLHEFYNWYLASIGDRSGAEFRNPLVERFYHESPLLTEAWKARLDDIIDGFDAGGYDPLLCAQDTPTRIETEQPWVGNRVASVVVRTDFTGHLFTVDLQGGNIGWRISNVTCANSPEGMAKAFYAWYLGAIGEPGTETFRNPIVQRDYHASGFLSEAFIAEIDELLSGDGLMADPFLLAQDIPSAFSVDPEAEPGTAVVHFQFGDTVVHRQVNLVQVDGRWLVDRVVEAQPQVSAPDA